MEPYSSDDTKRKKRRYEEWKIPPEEKVNRIIDKFENMVKLILNISDVIDNNLYSLQKRMDLLEKQVNALKYTMTQIKKIPIINRPALPSTIKEELPDHPCKTLINERPDLFDKRNQPRYSQRKFQGSYDATFKTILFGDAGCGKTMLTEKFLANLFVSDSKMTIGVDFEVNSLIVDEQKVKLQIWDFYGEERFRFLLPTYVRGARGGIFVYDTSNKSSIANIDKWLKIIWREIKEEDKFPILVVGIITEEKNKKQISTEKGMKVSKSRNLNGFIECNVKTGENVEEAFELITKLMLDNFKPRRVGIKPTIIEIRLEQVKESIQRYIKLKSKTNKQITRARTIRDIKKSLKIPEEEQSGDDDIWAFTISLSKSIYKRITPKTIYFR